MKQLQFSSSKEFMHISIRRNIKCSASVWFRLISIAIAIKHEKTHDRIVLKRKGNNCHEFPVSTNTLITKTNDHTILMASQFLTIIMHQRSFKQYLSISLKSQIAK